MICEKCNGKGYVMSNWSSSGVITCDECHGLGYLVLNTITDHMPKLVQREFPEPISFKDDRITKIKKMSNLKLAFFLDRLIFDEELHKQIYKEPLNTISKEERFKLLLDYLQEETDERL